MAEVASTGAGAPSRPSLIVALDAGTLGLRDVEHLARALALLLGGARDICTHAVADPWPHEVATIALDGPAEPAAAVTVVQEASADLGLHGIGVAAWSPYDDRILAAGEPAATGGATRALLARRDRTGGRAILFAGQDALVGTRAVRDLLAGSDIEAVDALGIPVDLDTPVVTRDFVRPVFRDGALVLALRPRADAMGCFEQPDPTPCCAMH